MKVQINKMQFNIRETSDESTLTTKDGYVLFGFTDYLKQEIVLRSGMTKMSTYRTLLHELTHAFAFAYGYSNNETFNHEQLCEFMACYATEIVRIANKYGKVGK